MDAALPSGVNFGPGERARMVQAEHRHRREEGRARRRLHPEATRRPATRTRRGCSRTTSTRRPGFVLTCRMPDGSGSGWAGITGVKDLSLIDAAHLTEVAADKALKSRKPRAIEPGRYTVILEPRADARFLSLMMGLFNARAAESPFAETLLHRQGAGHDTHRREALQRRVTLKSDIGNPILRQTPIGLDGSPRGRSPGSRRAC